MVSAAVIDFAAHPFNVAVTHVAAWSVMSVQVTVPVFLTDVGEIHGDRTTLQTGAVTVNVFAAPHTATPLVPVAEKDTVRVPVEVKFVNVHVHFFLVVSAAVIVIAEHPFSVAVTQVAARSVVSVQVTVPVVGTEVGVMHEVSTILGTHGVTVNVFAAPHTAAPLVPVAEKVTVRTPVEVKFVNVHIHIVLVESAAVIAIAAAPFSVAVTPVAAWSVVSMHVTVPLVGTEAGVIHDARVTLAATLLTILIFALPVPTQSLNLVMLS